MGFVSVRGRRGFVDRSVVLFLVGCLGPLALLTVSSITLAEHAVHEEVRSRVETTASVSASVVALEMSSLAELVRSYATRTRLVEAVGDGSLAVRDEEMVEFQLGQLLQSRPGIRGVFLTDPACVLTAIQPATPEIVGKDFSYRDWCGGVIESGKPYVSSADRTLIESEELVVAVIAPVRALGDLGDGVPVAYLAAIYSLAEIQRFADELDAAEGIALSIVDQLGTVLADGEQGATVDLSGRHDDPAVKLGLEGGRGVYEGEDNGTDVLVGYTYLDPLGWVVTAAVPARTAFAGVSDMRSKVYLIAFMLGVVLVLAGAFLNRTLRQRRTAEQIAQRNELRTRHILDAASDAFVSVRSDGVIIAWNSAAERLCGWSAAEATGRGVFELVVPPRDRGPLENGVQRFLDTGRGSILGQRVEMEVMHKDGRRIPVELAVTASEFGGEWTFNAFVHDISDRLQHQADLSQARDQALEASRLKSDFLANMSHEIRTPMNGVLGMTSLLLDTDLDPQQRESAETVLRSGEALLVIIDDILDFSKIEAGKLDLETIPFDMHHLATDVAALLGAAAYDKKVEMLVDIHPDVPHAVVGDPGRLRQVISNLVSNAIKFTEKGEVLIRISAGGVAHSDALGDVVPVRIEVSDTGIGIPLEVQSTIFDAFTQADASTTRTYGGTGLGLAICRELVGLMGGTIGVHSRVDAGSTFWLTIPFLTTEQPHEPEHRNDIESSRVLVVDDNETNRLILTRMLASWGATVFTAHDAAQAIVALDDAVERNEAFDTALIDYHMPGTDGMVLAEEMRAKGHEQVRLVLLTSSGQRGQAAAAKKAGMDAYLTKPVVAEQLRECLVTMHEAVGRQPDRPIITKHQLAEKISRRGRVLVAEDDPVNRKVAAGLLGSLGYDVQFAMNGAEAVAAVTTSVFDVVFMDCQMPVMDGFEASERIRSAEGSGHRIPIVALTASALVADRQRCLRAGMDDHLAKPIRRAELAAVLARFANDAPSLPRQDTSSPPTDESSKTSISARLSELFEGLDDLDVAIESTELLQSYQARAEAYYADLRSASADGDVGRLQQVAHALTGMAANVGVDVVATRARVIEDAARNGNVSDIDAALAELYDAIVSADGAVVALVGVLQTI